MSRRCGPHRSVGLDGEDASAAIGKEPRGNSRPGTDVGNRETIGITQVR
jgi:hypothetical protein